MYVLVKQENVGSSCGNYSDWVIKEILSVHYTIYHAKSQMLFQRRYGEKLTVDQDLHIIEADCPDT